MDCPKCKKALEKKNHCSYCSIYICPYCNSGQEFALAWYKAVLGLLLLPFLLIITWFITPLELPFSSIRCTRCGERYST
jgi:hypothetical protein